MSEQEQQEQVSLSMEEAVESLTGFDEIAIEGAFGADVTTLLTEKPTKAARALLFVMKRREGMKDPEARKAVMEMRLGDVQSYFIDEDDEDEAAGKDAGLPG